LTYDSAFDFYLTGLFL